jgi:hypothetical protein
VTVSGKAERGAGSPAMAALLAMLVLAQQVATKAARDALFLSHFAPDQLPQVMGAGAVLGIGTALVSGRWLARVGPNRGVPWLFALHAAAFALEHVAARYAPGQVAVVLYLHVASLGAVAASGFWLTVNERLDPYSGKRVIGRIGAGATLGGVIGGIATERLGRLLSIADMLLIFALLNGALAALGAFMLREPPRARGAPPEPAAASLDILRGVPYLRSLALLVGVLALADTIIDYVFKAEAGRAFGEGQALLAFFALFYTATSIATFFVQWLLNRIVIARLGLGGAVALLPAAGLLLTTAGIAAPGLLATVLLRGLWSVLESSLYRSGYELLYTPLAPAAKRATRGLLDVAVGRIGTIAGSAATVAALALAPPALVPPLLLGACAFLCAGTLALCLRLHAGYVAQLAASLRAGVVQLDASDVLDPATRRTLAESVATLDRAELLRKIEAMRGSIAPPVDAASPAAPPAWAERAIALGGADLKRARAALEPPLSAELIAPAIALLANDALAAAATAALRDAAPRCTGQLLDALLDHSRPPALRRRLPKILEAASGERVQRGLFAAQDDPVFAVRLRAAHALARVTPREGASALSESEIFAAIRRELQRTRSDESDRPAPSVPHAAAHEGGTANAAPQVIELVFALLGVCLEREAVALSLRAIFGTDSRLRGTALEYLDNVLPADVRELVWPLLRAARSERSRRPRQAIVEELVSSSAARPASTPSSE